LCRAGTRACSAIARRVELLLGTMTSVPSPGRIFVGGISWKADEAALKGFFETFGPVTECKIIMDKNTGCSKGYGFVTFADPETSEAVKAQTNLYFLGKLMNVGDAYRKVDQQNQQRLPNGVYPQQRQPQQQQPQPQQQAYRGLQQQYTQQQYRQPMYPAAPTGQYGYYDPYAQQYAYQYPGYTTPAQYGYPVQPQYATYYQQAQGVPQQPQGVPQGIVSTGLPSAQQGAWRPPLQQQPQPQPQQQQTAPSQNGILGDRPTQPSDPAQSGQ